MNLLSAIERSNLNEMLPEIARSAKPVLSFWGTRSIQAPNYQGAVPIDTLAAKVIQLVREKNFDYTQQEREIGKLISRNVDRIYQESDAQVANSNFITRFICGLIKFFYQFQSPRYYPSRTTSLIRWQWGWEASIDMTHDGYNRAFWHYTLPKFAEKYGWQPNPWHISNYVGSVPVENSPEVQLVLEMPNCVCCPSTPPIGSHQQSSQANNQQVQVEVDWGTPCRQERLQ